MSRLDIRRRQRGLTLIEAMVGIVIGLLVGLTAASMAQVFTASQRQGMSVGSTAMNTNTAMTSLRQDIGQAALGFFGEGSYLCDLMNLSVGSSVLLNSALFTPVSALRSPSTNFDTLKVTYATHIAGGTAVVNAGPSNGASIHVDSLLPAQVGDAVMLAAAPGPLTPQRICTIRTVTQVVNSTESSPQQLVFAPAGVYNSNAVTFDAGISVAEDKSSRVVLLGNLAMRTYAVDAQNNLVMTDELTQTKSILANDVVAFRVQFGASADTGSTTLADWKTPTEFGTVGINNISMLRAVRVGLVTRSQQREKTNKEGVCEATQVKPRVFGEEITDPVMTGSDWNCYRYRVAVAVVPMRNIAVGTGTNLGIIGGKTKP